MTGSADEGDVAAPFNATPPLQEALLNGRWDDARASLMALRDTYAIHLVADHESELFQGTYGSQRVLAPRVCLELTRSWEQFDRAFVPFTETTAAQQYERFLDDFLCAAGLPPCLGDDHLFVFSAPPSPWRTVVISRPFPAAPDEQAARIADAYRKMNNA